MKFEKFNEIFDIIEQRKNCAATENSYVSKLKSQGIDSVLKKIGEESAEVIMAVKDKKKSEIIHEVTDLFFHLLILLNFEDITPQEIANELAQRHMKKKTNDTKRK